MFRLHRLVIVEIISRESSSSMSEGFLEFVRMLNSISFKELKGNKSIVHILQKNTSLLSSTCLQSSMVRPLHLPWINRWQIPHLTASSQLAFKFWRMPQVNVWCHDSHVSFYSVKVPQKEKKTTSALKASPGTTNKLYALLIDLEQQVKVSVA